MLNNKNFTHHNVAQKLHLYDFQTRLDFSIPFLLSFHFGAKHTNPSFYLQL